MVPELMMRRGRSAGLRQWYGPGKLIYISGRYWTVVETTVQDTDALYRIQAGGDERQIRHSELGAAGHLTPLPLVPERRIPWGLIVVGLVLIAGAAE